MIQFKTGNTYNRDLFKPGTLYDLYRQVRDQKDQDPRKKIPNLLSEGELARLVEIYSCVKPGSSLLDVENDQILTTKLGNKVTGRDFKSMVRMVYEYARGDYAKIKQVEKNTYAAGVPLGLLAYRDHYGKKYNDFRLPTTDFEVSNTQKITPANDDVLEKVFHLDLLLGKALASTRINKEGTMVEWNSVYGLGILCADLSDVKISRTTIELMRPASLGRRNTSMERGYGANILSLEDFDEVHHNYIRLYNNCNLTIKHMLLQRWIYYMPQNSNMITSYHDWDKGMKPLDDGLSLSLSFSKEGGLFNI